MDTSISPSEVKWSKCVWHILLLATADKGVCEYSVNLPAYMFVAKVPSILFTFVVTAYTTDN